ncbi:MAG: esterase [Prevotellaceae bacterium]|jgi:enterochelin esterase family protein|nr:esterase [Prevotellaceae bacterium]
MKKNILLLALLLAATCYSVAQPAGGARRWINTNSPEVHADQTITFRYMAPNAKDVKLNAQFNPQPYDMKKDADGVWSVTVGPIEPDMYPYEFVVDGIRVMDPNNPDWFPNETFKGSMVEIPGKAPYVYSIQDVPHGNVEYVMYDAPSIGATGRLIVYTPPGYDPQGDKKYPVFYCISGTTDTEEVYFKVGRANFILDNLLAAGKAEPFIIVMPYGNPAYYFPPTEQMPQMDLFGTELMKDIIPFVDKNYRTINDRLGRGIGGFSRGGAQALRAGLLNTDKFAWVCSYASGVGAEDFERNFTNLTADPDKTNKEMKMIWTGVGNSDFLYQMASDFNAVLTKNRINHIAFIGSGGHTWMNAKLYLHETFQRLFQTANY